MSKGSVHCATCFFMPSSCVVDPSSFDVSTKSLLVTSNTLLLIWCHEQTSGWVRRCSRFLLLIASRMVRVTVYMMYKQANSVTKLESLDKADITIIFLNRTMMTWAEILLRLRCGVQPISLSSIISNHSVVLVGTTTKLGHCTQENIFYKSGCRMCKKQTESVRIVIYFKQGG